MNEGLYEIWSQLSDEGKRFARILVKRGYRGVREAMIYALETE